MVSLAEGLIVINDWGITIVLPALLIYALVYSLLAKTELLGDNQWANVMIASVSSLLFVTVLNAVKFTETFLPVVSAGLVVLFFFILLLKFVGVNESELFGFAEGKAKAGIILIAAIVFGSAIYAFEKVSPGLLAKLKSPFVDLWNTFTNPTILSMVILFGTLIVAAYYLLRETK